jgi:hypothetical protein
VVIHVVIQFVGVVFHIQMVLVKIAKHMNMVKRVLHLLIIMEGHWREWIEQFLINFILLWHVLPLLFLSLFCSFRCKWFIEECVAHEREGVREHVRAVRHTSDA